MRALDPDGVHALGELVCLTHLARRLAVLLVVLQRKAAAVCQLRTQHLRRLGAQLPVCVELLQVAALILVQHGENARNALADRADAAQAGLGTARLLHHAQLRQLLLVLRQRLEKIILALLAQILNLHVVRHGSG
ncbi:60S ribosomal protein L35, putative [Leishmania tarentolae]|uniref:60S ribosomal protein L35, putative n=1 Tax=Leishmania tarentolae TaxID=5689 RepID=A0A640KJV1_LEITA|nr:60S ribosomal protein L35, putative [Leishmania tarentolae]